MLLHNWQCNRFIYTSIPKHVSNELCYDFMKAITSLAIGIFQLHGNFMGPPSYK